MSEPTHVHLTEDDFLKAAVAVVQRAVFAHPIAARAFFRAMAAEGRAFAETEEGQAWLVRLRGSPLLDRARTAFDTVTADALSEAPHQPLPTALVDALIRLAHAPHMEKELVSLLDRTLEHDR